MIHRSELVEWLLRTPGDYVGTGPSGYLQAISGEEPDAIKVLGEFEIGGFPNAVDVEIEEFSLPHTTEPEHQEKGRNSHG